MVRVAWKTVKRFLFGLLVLLFCLSVWFYNLKDFPMQCRGKSNCFGVSGNTQSIQEKHTYQEGINGVSGNTQSVQENHTYQEGINGRRQTQLQPTTKCQNDGGNYIGPLYVDETLYSMKDLENKFSSEFNGWVNKGGAWNSTGCKARAKVALIIPFRNRSEHLSLLINHIHPILKRQNLDYRIIVVEQEGDDPFNRGMLLNAGYKEALKFDQYECFVFHDVDLLPENDRIDYACPYSPMHLSAAISKKGYRLPYSSYFGGVSAFRKNHFELINGFSNVFWGWGGEDDDLYIRVQTKRLALTRIPAAVGRYKAIKKFHKSSVLVKDKFGKLRTSSSRMSRDGLTSLKYEVKQLIEYPLYTFIKVKIEPATTTTK